MEEKIKIELSKEDAELFLWFRKWQNLLEKAKEELRPGALILHFDSSGEIRKTEFHIHRQIEKFIDS
jgi:hypothetical protein